MSPQYVSVLLHSSQKFSNIMMLNFSEFYFNLQLGTFLYHVHSQWNTRMGFKCDKDVEMWPICKKLHTWTPDLCLLFKKNDLLSTFVPGLLFF